jgi:hypothetical protein
MSTTTEMDATTFVQEGWKLLVEQLGLQKATQFVMLLERGKGDSVKETHDYWGEVSLDEIHQRVTAWKTKQP